MFDLLVPLNGGGFADPCIANQIGTAGIPAGTAIIRIGIAIEARTIAAETLREDAEVVASAAMSWVRTQVETPIHAAGFVLTRALGTDTDPIPARG
jgi:hypothetical protein